MAGSSLSTPVAVNPYVGPRPFETGEHLFGREHEITKLYYVLSAERIVLLHSPSGAGKSSMIQAGLLPRLRERFDVWRPTRVNLPRPAGISESANRYVLSAALGFEQSIPEELRRSPEELAGMALIDCVRTRKRRPSAPANVLLIFDQFEEILTTDPLAMEARQEFFDQLGEVLRDPTHWALFAMREDFLAPLDPYVERVPTHMQNRFRIDLLGLDEAREAIAQPSQEGGRVFEDAAVGKLVNDLATMKVQQPDGSFQDQVGLHVEPLQLQVVCRGLWERLSPEKRSIAVDDVTELGDVTEALSSYYSMEVSRIANGEVTVEREVREWVGDKLITPDGTRGQVLRGAGKTEGLSNTLVAKLVDTHLVRAEHRAGAVWYELAHDRLIDPTRVDNTKWLDAHLNQVQKRASLWAAQGQPDGLLLLGTDLVEARRWAREQGSLTEDEQRFMNASAVAQADTDRQRRLQRRTLWLGVAAMMTALACGFAFSIAWKQKLEVKQTLADLRDLYSRDQAKDVDLRTKDKDLETREKEIASTNGELKKSLDGARELEDIAVQEKTHAKEESQVALAGKLIAQANDTLTKRPDLLQLTTLVALESMKRDRSVGADHFLRQSLSWLRTPLGPPIGDGTKVESIAFGDDNKSVAIIVDGGAAKVFDVQTGQLRFPLNRAGFITNVAFHGEYLATISTDGTARLWNASTGLPAGGPYPLGSAEGNTAICFSSAGLYVAFNANDRLRVWKLGNIRASRVETFVVDPTTAEPKGAPLFKPDCTQLTAARGNIVKTWTWAVDGWQVLISTTLPAIPEGTARVISPDGSRLATISGKVVNVWSVPFTDEPTQRGFDKAVLGFAFSPEENYFATAGADRTVRLWHLTVSQTGDRSVREVVRLTHAGGVQWIAFSTDGKVIASVDVDNTVRLWRTTEEVDGVTTTFRTKSGLLAAISTNGQHLAVGDPRKIQVFRAENGALESELPLEGRDAKGAIVYDDISSDGRYVAASIRGTIDFPTSYLRQVWNRASGKVIFRSDGLTRVPVFMFSPDGNYVAIGASRDIGADLQVRDLIRGRQVQIPHIDRNTEADANYQFFFTPDSKYLCIAGDDRIHLLDTVTWTDHQILAGAHIWQFVASANGQFIALSTYKTESTAQVWRIGETKPRARIAWKGSAVSRNTALALSPDGEYLYSADWSNDSFSADRRLRVWNIATRQVIGEMPLEGRANWFSLSADGTLLGVATERGLQVWDQAQREEAASTEMSANSLLTAFSPYGKYLLTIDSSQNVTSWFWDPSRIAGAVCAKLTQNLTAEQWAQYLPGEPYRKTCPNRPVPVRAPTE